MTEALMLIIYLSSNITPGDFSKIFEKVMPTEFIEKNK